MEPAPDLPIVSKESHLRIGDSIAGSNVATIFELHDGLDAFVYKQYKHFENFEAFARDRLVNVPNLIDLYRNLEQDRRDMIQANFGWPVSSVLDSQELITGVILWKAADGFFAKLLGNQFRARDFNYVIYEPRAAKVGVSPTSTFQK